MAPLPFAVVGILLAAGIALALLQDAETSGVRPCREGVTLLSCQCVES
jgi:hypothetical protein